MPPVRRELRQSEPFLAQQEAAKSLLLEGADRAVKSTSRPVGGPPALDCKPLFHEPDRRFEPETFEFLARLLEELRDRQPLRRLTDLGVLQLRSLPIQQGDISMG